MQCSIANFSAKPCGPAGSVIGVAGASAFTQVTCLFGTQTCTYRLRSTGVPQCQHLSFGPRRCFGTSLHRCCFACRLSLIFEIPNCSVVASSSSNLIQDCLFRCAIKRSTALPARRYHRSSTCKTYAATNKISDAGWEGFAGSVGVGLIWAGLACMHTQSL